MSIIPFLFSFFPLFLSFLLFFLFYPSFFSVTSTDAHPSLSIHPHPQPTTDAPCIKKDTDAPLLSSCIAAAPAPAPPCAGLRRHPLPCRLLPRCGRSPCGAPTVGELAGPRGDPGRHGGGLHLCSRRPPAELLYRGHGGGPGGAPPPPPMLAAWRCSSMGHGGILLGISLNCRGILVQVSAGVRRSRGELRFPAPAPLFCPKERKSWALPSGSRFFSLWQGFGQNGSRSRRRSPAKRTLRAAPTVWQINLASI
jgi:hypothetical protein